MQLNSQEIKTSFFKIVAFFKKWRLLTYGGLALLTYSNANLRSSHITMRNDYNDLKTEFAVLQETNQELLRDMVLYNRSYEEFPLPIWQKVKRDMDFIAQYFNPAYEVEFFTPLGFTRFEKMGETDFDNFDYKTALIYYNRDLQMAIDGGSKLFSETYLDSQNVRKKVNVLKWRVIERKDTLIYGMVLPKKN